MVDKPLPRTGKRDASGTAPSEARGAGTAGRGRGERRGGFSGNDGGTSEILLTLQKQRHIHPLFLFLILYSVLTI